MFLLALFALFVILPVAEIYVIIQIGQLIGTFWTIVALQRGPRLRAAARARNARRRARAGRRRLPDRPRVHHRHLRCGAGAAADARDLPPFHRAPLHPRAARSGGHASATQASARDGAVRRRWHRDRARPGFAATVIEPEHETPR